MKKLDMRTIEIVPFSIIKDDYFLNLLHEVKNLGYKSFSDYFLKEIIYPHIYFTNSKYSVDYCSFLNKLITLNDKNIDKLFNYAKQRNIAKSFLIAHIIDTFLKDK